METHSLYWTENGQHTLNISDTMSSCGLSAEANQRYHLVLLVLHQQAVNKIKTKLVNIQRIHLSN